MAPHLERGATAGRAGPRGSQPRHRRLGAWAIGLGAGAVVGLSAAGGYLAAVPASYRGTAAIVAEAGPGGASADRVAALLGRTILADGVLSRADPALDPAALRRRLAVSRPEALVFEIAALGADRDGAARLSNAVAEAFLAAHGEQAAAQAASAPGSAAPALAAARAGLEEAERRLQAVRAARPAPAGEPAFDEAERTLALARAKLAEAKARADTLQAALAGGRDPDLSAEAPASPALDRLRQALAEAIRAEASQKTTLGPLHPAVKEAEDQTRTARRLFLDEVKRAARAAAADQAAAAARVAALEEQIAARRRAASAADERLGALEAEAEARRGALRAAEQASEAALDRAAAAVPVRLLRAATPEEAERRPDPATILGIGLAGGALAGLFGAAALRPGRRRRAEGDGVRVEPAPEAPAPRLLPFHAEPPAPDGADRTAAAPPLSPLQALAAAARERWALPRLSGPAATDEAGRPSAEPTVSPYGEAVRRLCRRFDAEVQPGRALTLLIVSERAGAGRSTLAAHLAQAFAEAGRRVVVIDGTSRAAGGLGAPAFVPSRPGAAPSYQVLPIGSLSPQAPANVQHGRIAWSLIRLARSAFDVAIVDAPALEVSRLALGGADADAAIVLCPGDEPDAFASLALVEPRSLAEMEPALRGTLAA